MRTITSTLAILALLLPSSTLAQILISTHVSSCLNLNDDLTAPIAQLLNFTTLYAQFDQGQQHPGEYSHGFNYDSLPTIVRDSQGTVLTGTGDLIRIVLTGTTGATAQGYSNTTSFLSTLSLDSQVLTFPVLNNQSALCSSIRTSSAVGSDGTSLGQGSGCPYGPGDISLGFSIPVSGSYPLTTITTQLLVLDPSVSALHLACYNIALTPYYPSFFAYNLIRYMVVGVLATFLAIYLIARLWASRTDFIHESETHLASSLTLKLTSTASDALSKRKVWASIWYGAWAGRQVVGSGSLRRFVTAEFRELWGTIIWFSLVGTVAVDWPDFSYPIFARTAWSSLIYSNTLSFTSPAASLLPTTNFVPPTLFSTQMADPLSPLYLNSSLPPVLLDLTESRRGIEKWAQAVGVRPQDLWSVCAYTFFLICAGVVGMHIVCFAFDLGLDLVRPEKKRHSRLRSASNKGSVGGEGSISTTNKEGGGGRSTTATNRAPEDFDSGDFTRVGEEEEDAEDSYALRPRPEDDYPSWRLHLALLQGNLTRVLILFHLPLTLFSVYEVSHFSTSPSSSFALACVVLALVCVIAPFGILLQMHRKSIRELFTSLPLLLSVGPLYNTYSEECTMFSSVRIFSNIIVAVLIGAVQSTGIAQAAVILLTEVADTLVTSLWLPWGDNAAMGPLAFVLSIARIIIAVLLVVLSPAVNVSLSAAGWLSYIVFLVQALVVILLYFVLVFKLIELGVRMIGDAPFDESRSPRVGGLFGAIRRLDKSVGGSGKKRRHPSSRQREIEERRKRNMRRGTDGGYSDGGTVGSHTRMLNESHRRDNSSLSVPRSMSSYENQQGYGRTPVHSSPMPFADDDGYIMSAMSSSQWGGGGGRAGYVQPGAYSTSQQPHQQPILRSGPVYHEHATVVPAPTSFASSGPPASFTPASPPDGSTGFSRVGGGKASSNNPYQLVKAPQSGYPPYPPPNSADMYNTSNSPNNLRRLSQSAVIELAGPTEQQQARSRPLSGSILPSSSALLSNASTPYKPERQFVPTSVATKQRAGFFGRFKKRQPVSGDFSSDDEGLSDSDIEEEEAVKRRGNKGWGMFGKKKEGKAKAEENEAGTVGGETGFSVVRKARPRLSPPGGSASNNSTGTTAAPPTPTTETPLLGIPAPPIVVVQSPSQPSTPIRDSRNGQGVEVEDWGRAS